MQMLIGGDRVDGAAGTYEVVNPATEGVVGLAPDASVEQAHQAAEAAAEAFASWSRTTPEHRANLLERAADLFEQKVAELVPLVQAETGATMRVAKTMQVPVVASRLRRYARGALEPASIPLPPQEMPATALAPGGLIGAVAHRAPVGVVACITPYNFPIVNAAGKVGPALAMGNTVVVKPAPQDPLAVLALADVFTEAGFPPGVVNIINSKGPAPAEALVAHDKVDMVSFTGSTAVGCRIAEVAGRNMTRLLLELGGKGASLIFDDADLRQAIPGTGSTWAFHSGQICTAPTRVLAQRGVYDEVVEGLAKYASALSVGDPLDPKTVLGPVISAAQRDRAETFTGYGVADGGTVMAGGSRPEHLDTGYFWPATLVADCTADSRIAQEEIFGPVVCVIPFDDVDEGIAMANSTPFGLYDYVWTGDGAKAMAVARQLRSGNVGINTLQRNHEAPFGGMKLSGVGRDGGSFGLHAYTELQSVVWSA